jgi:hypothetical protein
MSGRIGCLRDCSGSGMVSDSPAAGGQQTCMGLPDHVLCSQMSSQDQQVCSAVYCTAVMDVLHDRLYSSEDLFQARTRNS